MSYDLELTKQLLGDVGPLRFNPKVVKVCQQCGKQDIVRYKGRKKPTAAYYCRKCVVNRDSVKNKKSEATKKQWESTTFRETVSANSKKNWENPELRYKMSAVRRDPENLNRLRKNARKAGLVSVQRQTGRVSMLQQTLYSMLDDLGVTYETEFCLGPYVFDCKIGHLLIECNGDYWHNLPKNKARDKAKLTFIEKYHEFELRYLWEHEFLNYDKVVESLKYWLKLADPDIVEFEFNEVIIKPALAKDYKLLLAKYHYLTSAGRNGIACGGFVGDQLCCVAIFSPLSRQNIIIDGYSSDQVRELSRFCIHPRYQRKNFGSWFLSRAIKSLDKKFECIVSYADTTFNHSGAIYKAANFKQDGIVRPDYWYVSEDGWVMHKKTLYNHARSLKMTESEFAASNCYTKVWGKEKLRFVYRR